MSVWTLKIQPFECLENLLGSVWLAETFWAFRIAIKSAWQCQSPCRFLQTSPFIPRPAASKLSYSFLFENLLYLESWLIKMILSFYVLLLLLHAQSTPNVWVGTLYGQSARSAESRRQNDLHKPGPRGPLDVYVVLLCYKDIWNILLFYT